MTEPLGPAELLTLSGADAVAFAHAQFTNDVKSLSDGAWQWSAWLDAQGRAHSFFALIRVDSTQLIAWLPLGGAQAMRDALARFVFRAAVKLDAPGEWSLHAMAPAELATTPNERQALSHAGGYVLALPGASPRLAWLTPGVARPVTLEALDRWRLNDVAAGLPLLAPELGGEFVPQALDLERLDAIRFDKGCYPGQEIVARLHFRGGNKRHLRHLRVQGAAPAIGTSLLGTGGEPVGQILYAAPDSAGASVAVAVLTQSASGSVTTAIGSRCEIGFYDNS